MNLKLIADEINLIIKARQEALNLTFTEDDHKYFMNDINGVNRNDFPSVSKILSKFYNKFDAKSTRAFQNCEKDPVREKALLEEWRLAGEYATNMGSRVHFLLEKSVVDMYGSYKSLRQPIYTCDEVQEETSDNMITAGVDFINLMHERGAVLLDTEIVLGDPELAYTGQPDKVWLMSANEKLGFVITDWKTNKQKNFEIQSYTGWMLSPFETYPDTVLAHYYIQISLYAKLIKKMLQGSKYSDINYFGGVIVLLKNDKTFVEYRIPKDVTTKVLEMTKDVYL